MNKINMKKENEFGLGVTSNDITENQLFANTRPETCCTPILPCTVCCDAAFMEYEEDIIL